MPWRNLADTYIDTLQNLFWALTQSLLTSTLHTAWMMGLPCPLCTCFWVFPFLGVDWHEDEALLLAVLTSSVSSSSSSTSSSSWELPKYTILLGSAGEPGGIRHNKAHQHQSWPFQKGESIGEVYKVSTLTTCGSHKTKLFIAASCYHL